MKSAAFYFLLSICASEPVVFQEDFNRFDLSVWKHDLTLAGGGNWEFQRYVNNRSNSFVRDGKLHIQPTILPEEALDFPVDIWGLTPASACTSNMFWGCQRQNARGNPISSAKISTSDSFKFGPGHRMEVRAKLPRGDWLWPAIWLLPRHEMYGNWPASGEIDILEATGNDVNYVDTKGNKRGVDTCGSALHWGVSAPENKFDLTVDSYTLPYSDFNKEFHTFGLVWTMDGLFTYVDDEANKIMKVDMSDKTFFEKGGWGPQYDNPWQYSSNMNAPFDEEFYIVMNLAVGGVSGYFPDNAGNKPWGDKSSNAADDFWRAKDKWLPSWEQNDNSFQVDSVTVTRLETSFR